MSNHAKYSPSSAYRWTSCTKSLTLPEKPYTTNISAIRGTTLHEMSDDMLNGRQLKLMYDDYTPTEEDVQNFVIPYVNYVEEITASHGFYEQKVMLSEDCYGTVDALLYNEPTKTLHVIDLKCGMTKVYVKKNKQLGIYAIGAVNFLRKQKLVVEKIFTHIFQPALGGAECEEVFKRDLKDLRFDVLKVVEDVKEDNVKFDASGSNCRWCPHVAECPAVLEMANKAAKEDFIDEVSLSDKYKMVPVLKAFVSKVEEMTHMALELGEEVKGFKLKEGKNRRHWSDDDTVLKYLMKNKVLKREAVESKLLSVAKIEKLLKEKKVNVELSDFIYLKQNKPSIVSDGVYKKKKEE